MALLDVQTYAAVLREVVNTRRDFAIWGNGGPEFMRDDNSDSLVFRLRPHYPDVVGRVDARDLMFTATQAAQAIIGAAHTAMARGRGQVFRALVTSNEPVDWLGDGDADKLLAVIDTLVLKLAEAEKVIRDAAAIRT